MTPARRMAPLVGLAALVFCACGSEGGGGADDGPEVTFPDHGPGDPGGDDRADSGTHDPGLAPGAHPHWGGVAWQDFLPGSSQHATYRMKTPRSGDESVVTVQASAKDGFVPWGSGNWTRVAFGLPSASPGEADALLVFLDWKTPWVLKVKGVEVHEKYVVDGPADVIVFDEPLEIPLAGPEGQYTVVTASARSDPSDPDSSREATFRLGVESYDAPCGDAFPGLKGCARYHAKAWGALVGMSEAQPAVVDVIAHPQQRVLLWNNAPGFVWIEQSEGWQ